jgi:hypothetical protein
MEKRGGGSMRIEKSNAVEFFVILKLAVRLRRIA